MSTADTQGTRPFQTAPDPRRYFPAGAIEEARRRVARCIERSEGPALVVGPAGCGKSLLVEVLARQFAKSRSVVRLTGAQLCTRRSLLQSILFELGESYRGLDEGELRLSILQHLRGAEPTRHVLILVDEADALPIRLLEELRLLSGVVSEGQLLVQLVLCGRQGLEERFADPQLDAFSQRLAVRAYLAPLTRDETIRYVQSQAAAAGWRPETWFTDECLETLYRATEGVPRLVNQLADLLVVGAEGKCSLPLGADDVRRTWAELQQLPLPWSPVAGVIAGHAPHASVVEYSVPRCEESSGRSQNDCVELVPLDDDLPASIPFGGRTESLASEKGTACSDEFEAVRDDDDPFAEPFEEEEVVLDPYLAFESALLVNAPRVMNSVDQSLATALSHAAFAARETAPREADMQLVGRKSSSDVEHWLPPADASICSLDPGSSTFHAVRVDGPVRSAPNSEILLVDDQDEPVPTVVPSRQFRRLFSALESGTPLTAYQKK